MSEHNSGDLIVDLLLGAACCYAHSGQNGKPTNAIYPIWFGNETGCWQINFAVENYSEYPFHIAPIVTATFKVKGCEKNAVFEIIDAKTGISGNSRATFTARERRSDGLISEDWQLYQVHVSVMDSG